jgi:hypothetical protein
VDTTINLTCKAKHFNVGRPFAITDNLAVASLHSSAATPKTCGILISFFGCQSLSFLAAIAFLIGTQGSKYLESLLLKVRPPSLARRPLIPRK